MSTTSKAPPKGGHKHPRSARGLKLYRERGDEIAHILPHTYSVPSCTGSTISHVVRLDRGTCECPDRTSPCKHLFAATIYAAKRRCRRERTAGRPSRIPRETRDGHRDQSSGGGDVVRPRRSDGSRESLQGAIPLIVVMRGLDRMGG